MADFGISCERCLNDEKELIKGITSGDKYYRKKICKQCDQVYYTIEEPYLCPECSGQNTFIFGTRKVDGNIHRDRECKDCLTTYKTTESVQGISVYNETSMKAVINTKNQELINIFQYK